MGATITLNCGGTVVPSGATIAAVSIDGGPETNVDLFAFNDTGDVLVYTSPTLATGNHTLQVRNTGTHNPSSVGTVTSIDRFNITP